MNILIGILVVAGLMLIAVFPPLFLLLVFFFCGWWQINIWKAKGERRRRDEARYYTNEKGQRVRDPEPGELEIEQMWADHYKRQKELFAQHTELVKGRAEEEKARERLAAWEARRDSGSKYSAKLEFYSLNDWPSSSPQDRS